MTLRPNEPELPGWQSHSCDDSPSQSAERHDERHALIRLADRILTSWANTARVLIVLGVLTALVTGALWLLDINIHIGSVRITSR